MARHEDHGLPLSATASAGCNRTAPNTPAGTATFLLRGDRRVKVRTTGQHRRPSTGRSKWWSIVNDDDAICILKILSQPNLAKATDGSITAVQLDLFMRAICNRVLDHRVALWRNHHRHAIR